MNLLDLQQVRTTDKFALGYVDTFYEKHFANKRLTAKSVLEIGIYEGESILLWHDYFTNAKIYGLDISKSPNRKEFTAIDERLILLDNTDAYTSETVNKIKQMEPYGLDIVIDDGPHTLSSMMFFIRNYLPLVKKGGIFVLEDVIDPSTTQKLQDLIVATLNTFAKDSNVYVYDMRGKQKTQGLLNQWSRGLDVFVVEVL